MASACPVPSRWALDELAAQIAKPPHFLPLYGHAVIRSFGDLCRWDGRIWRWDGRDWVLVGSDPRVRS